MLHNTWKPWASLFCTSGPVFIFYLQQWNRCCAIATFRHKMTLRRWSGVCWWLLSVSLRNKSQQRSSCGVTHCYLLHFSPAMRKMMMPTSIAISITKVVRRKARHSGWPVSLEMPLATLRPWLGGLGRPTSRERFLGLRAISDLWRFWEDLKEETESYRWKQPRTSSVLCVYARKPRKTLELYSKNWVSTITTVKILQLVNIYIHLIGLLL